MKSWIKMGAALTTSACVALGASSGVATAQGTARPSECADSVLASHVSHAKPGVIRRPRFLADAPTSGSGVIGPYDYGTADQYKDYIKAEGGGANIEHVDQYFDVAYSFAAGGGC